MKTIGIIGAMPDEVAILKDGLENMKEAHTGGIDVYTGILHGKSIALCCCGMGKASAAAATQLLISEFKVDAIINSGIAGNMTPVLNVGDVAVSTSVINHDGENNMINQSYPYQFEFTADEKLVSAAARACHALNITCATGRIATGDQFIGDSATKKRITDMFAPLCVEMEGAAIGHIAAKNDKPFVIIRSMSDNADEAAHEELVVKHFDITEYCKTASAITALTVKNYE